MRASAHSAQYRAHIASPEWRLIRKAALARAGYRCQLCNASHRLEVHHRTYVNLGHEHPEDLTVLCDDCHKLADRQRRARTRPARQTRRRKRRLPKPLRDLRFAAFTFGGVFVGLKIVAVALPT